MHYEAQVTPIFERYLYRPVIRAVEWLADAIRPVQSGDVNLYLLYVFAMILLAYLLGARVKAIVAWLVLTYRLPASSALKTTIRRKLTGIGAVYLANAVAVLPASPAAERALRQTRNTIAGAGVR